MKSFDKLKIFIWSVLLGTLTFITQNTFAQEIRSDYERALRMREMTANKVFKDRVTEHWLEDNIQFWYRNDLPDERRQFILVDVEAGIRQPAFDHEQLAKALAAASSQEVSVDQLPIEKLQFSDSGSQLTFTSKGKKWKCDLQSYALELLSEENQIGDSLEPGYRIRPSGRSDEDTWITFMNQTAGDVEVYWIDSERQRRHYFTVGAGEDRRQHTYVGHVWLVMDKANKKGVVFVAADESRDAVITDECLSENIDRRRRGRRPQQGQAESPDGKWTAFIKDNNLYIRSSEDETEVALSSEGIVEDAYNEQFYWSPDSKKIVVMRVRKGDDHKVHFVESAPKDQLQPKLHSFSYAKPGDKIDHPRPVLFNVADRLKIDISDELFANPWSITQIHWMPDSSRFTFIYNQRGHQILRIIAVDAIMGAISVIIDEQSETFIDYSGKQFSHFVDETKEIIWMSERDGWNHLYLYDVESGSVKNQITKGNWVVRSIEQVDETKRQIWFYAGGVYPNQNPYYIHLCRVNFDGSGFTILTEGDGTHEIKFSPDKRFFIDRWSRVDKPVVTELRSSDDGRLICELECADWSALLETGWRPPERFVAKGRDGETDIYGIIIRPTNFDPNKKYPVIEEIYAGPQGAFAPKSFGLQVRQHSIAELGFIVVQIDGMGTSYRSKAFHDVCWKNLGDSGFPDRILWMKAAAEKYSYMDLSRVGIYGGSAGGQSSLRALLAHGDFYKAAVSDCGCHDNRMDKIWWNEQWMGWPLGPHYEEQSNVTQAHKLQGKLLLTVGELDRNVDPASTMQVVDALVKANKDFEMLIVPGRGHGVGEIPYANRRRMDFFVRHLLNKEPPDWNNPEVSSIYTNINDN
jgi:dipeptidyl-peptidase-4